MDKWSIWSKHFNFIGMFNLDRSIDYVYHHHQHHHHLRWDSFIFCSINGQQSGAVKMICYFFKKKCLCFSTAVDVVVFGFICMIKYISFVSCILFSLLFHFLLVSSFTLIIKTTFEPKYCLRIKSFEFFFHSKVRKK